MLAADSAPESLAHVFAHRPTLRRAASAEFM